MNEIIEIKHITTFSPCHHNIEISEPLTKIENTPSHEFEVQEMNIKHILSNNLGVKDNRNLNMHSNIPENIQEVIFSGIAQKQFEKELAENKTKKFELGYDSVPDSDPSP